MEKVFVNSQGKVLATGGEALKVTASVDSNIIPSNIKKDVNILGVTGTYEGSGGTINASIINPINGGILGNSGSVGRVTHQYQVTGGNISSCFLIPNVNALYYSPFISDEVSNNYNNISTTLPCSVYGSDCEWSHGPSTTNECSIIISITNSGLFTVNYNRSSSDVNEYEWQENTNCLVCIVLDNGCILQDSVHFFYSYSCFIKDTQIVLYDNSQKFIQDITYGDELLVWNFDEGKYDKAKPVWIKKEQKTTWYYKLTFSDGNTLCVTGAYPNAHSLYSVDDNKFVHANKLIGKRIYTLNGIKTLVNCEEIHEVIEFYNIITNYHMNLFANNILTSTSLNNLYPIANMKFVKEPRIQKVDYSFLDKNIIYGLRLNEQPNDVSDYCKNLIKLKL